MKLAWVFTLSAIGVASTAFQGATVAAIDAVDSELSTDASLSSVSVLEAAESAVEATAASDCLAKGFDAETLDCRVCNLLALTLSLQQEENATTDAALAKAKQRATEDAVGTCQRCCTDVEAIDALAHGQQYARVVLEVCTCKFGRLPKIANFVNHHATQHARLEIKYMNARMPHLLFYDDSGEKKEEISIASWDEETISEFIEAKLKPQEDEAVEETTSEEVTSESDAEEQLADAEIVGEEPVESDAATDDDTENDVDEIVEVEVTAQSP